MNDPRRASPAATSPETRSGSWWIVALAFGLCGVVIGVLVFMLAFGNDGSSEAEIGCGERAVSVLNRDFDGGNGSATPLLAVEELLNQNPEVARHPGEWRSEGTLSEASAADVEQPLGDWLLIVRRDGSRATGEIVVAPAGSGWNAISYSNCP